MNHLIAVFNEMFETSVTEENLMDPIENFINWDSFVIMGFMSEMADRYQADIDIMQISEIETVGDLVKLIQLYEK